MNSLLLLLLDSRAPAGAHHHSGGMEAAIGTGLVTGLADVEDFCQTRLRTSARVAAAFAAASCHLAERAVDPASRHLAERAVVPAPCHLAERAVVPAPGQLRMALAERAPQDWALLDAEFEARTPSQAARAASRQLGGGLVRLLRFLLPDADLTTLWARCPPPAPHHPLVLGAGVALAGGNPELAARAAALACCAGPASAAVRLLGLDPFAVQAMLARLAPGIDECAAAAAYSAAGLSETRLSETGLSEIGPLAGLAADAAPTLDLLPDVHLTAEVRLFAS
jgi:urease accessory protein